MLHGEKLTYSPYGHAKLVNSCHDRVTYIEPRAIAAFQRDLPGCSHGDDQEVFVGGNQTWRRFLGAHARLQARESRSGVHIRSSFPSLEWTGSRETLSCAAGHRGDSCSQGVEYNVYTGDWFEPIRPRVHTHSSDIQASKYIVYISRANVFIKKGRYLPAGPCMFTFRVGNERWPMPMLVIALDIGLYGNITGMHAATSLVALSIDNFMD